MSAVHKLITDHLDIWTAADTEKKSGRGRAAGSANSVYGIKKLRELILELAVRGKLVPQDPNDVSLENLMRHIEVQDNASSRKNRKKSSGVDKVNIPPSWRHIKLSQLVRIINGRAYKKEELLATGTPVLRVGNLFTSDHWYYSDLTLESDKYCDSGDLLYAWSASFGPFIWSGERAIFHYHIWKLDFYFPDLISKKYLYTYLLQQTQKIKASGHGVMMVHMTKEKMEELLVNLPPLEEQNRIVAKVDELMALCDQLEQQHNNAAEAHEQLVSHLLGTLTQSQDPDDFNANWQRIADHFDTLFTTESSIEALKQTILQLAVMGKLVRQDPNDEPASELLKRIKAERAKFIAEEKIKKGNPLPPMTDKDKPFELPDRWTWVQWNEILAYDDAAFKRGPFGSSLTKGMFVESGYKVYEQYCPINDDCSFERYYITAQKFEEMKGFAVKAGDYLVSCSGATLGRITQVPPDFKEGIINQAILRVRINHQYYDNNFFKLLFRSEFFQRQITDNSTGSAIPNVKGVKDLKIMPVPLLGTAEQVRIVNKVEELMKLCEQLKSRISNKLNQQRKLAIEIVKQTAN
ncbi:restriction endonuclease subunit S [Undibacterium cyanobacteriorum]|uniref:Restriction endonuclease subunit S n=1 Tax=Undibacterium cyanobacteriorum TaxID=3073561 RepID=A0ABY9RGZ1_9BURK|nr:restriction endonuclease subunit S [Undibacterium sp. 20NA77.5]WMW80119.1 restriction endonuclease subunit S [Undibacterium sp. 20NA77.5]